ncbi:MAG TPA: hypothetical protein VJR23_08055 [Candidatus Acidoferrales bacterium]|nr:hypothetical protein [Candidatus Acidoferrales bacterium]
MAAKKSKKSSKRLAGTKKLSSTRTLTTRPGLFPPDPCAKV